MNTWCWTYSALRYFSIWFFLFWLSLERDGYTPKYLGAPVNFVASRPPERGPTMTEPWLTLMAPRDAERPRMAKARQLDLYLFLFQLCLRILASSLIYYLSSSQNPIAESSFCLELYSPPESHKISHNSTKKNNLNLKCICAWHKRDCCVLIVCCENM